MASLILKRALDVAIAAGASVVAVPVCLILMIAIRAESPGNPLFTQWRVGRHQQPFRMLKLRTMSANTAHVPSHEVAAARITRLGRVLRRLKLDELPQLLNVLAGSMSLVGPRPCLASQAELIAAREARGLFAFPPGVTGPAQLLNIDMSEPVRLAEVEADYFHRAGFWSDLRIIFRTLTGGGAGDAAPGQR
jgi:lipopolysaccharide/colanic/teichoic acid biosynthesis glycosyltransferase